MPRYAYKYVRQRELGKKAKRPLKYIDSTVDTVLHQGERLNYKAYFDGLKDKRRRLRYRLSQHRLIRAPTAGMKADMERMKQSLKEVEDIIDDLGL